MYMYSFSSRGAREPTKALLRNKFVDRRVCELVEILLKCYRSLRVEHITNVTSNNAFVLHSVEIRPWHLLRLNVG